MDLVADPVALELCCGARGHRMSQDSRASHGCLLQCFERKFRLVRTIHGYRQRPIVESAPGAMIFDAHFGNRTIRDDDDVVCAVLDGAWNASSFQSPRLRLR